MKSCNRVPIVFAINDGYCKQLAVVIRSILLHSGSHFDFYILSTSLSKDRLASLRKVTESVDRLSSIQLVDMNQVLHEDLEKFMCRRDNYNYISTETYYRFYIARVLHHLDKAIYLDGDILVLNDLRKLYEEDLGDDYAGAVQDSWIKYQRQCEKFKTASRPHMTVKEYCEKVVKIKEDFYFNAGVLLLNLKKLREDGVEDKLWDFTRNNSPLEFQDQDVLNAVFSGRTKRLHSRWNFLKDCEHIKNRFLDISFQYEINEAIGAPGVVHFVGSDKPWCVKSNEYKYISEWWDIFKGTGLETDQDEIIYNKILKSELEKKYMPYFALRILGFDIVHIYRENWRFYLYVLGILVVRKRLR